MILYVTPIEWRHELPSTCVPVPGADHVSPSAARQIRRTYRDLRTAGSRGRRSRGRTFEPARARQIIAHLIGTGWAAGYTAACEPFTAVPALAPAPQPGPGWRLVTDAELAARATTGAAA